jgi:hypothetical protein
MHTSYLTCDMFVRPSLRVLNTLRSFAVHACLKKTCAHPHTQLCMHFLVRDFWSTQDIAIESADMVLMRGKLHDVLTALSLSRAIFRRIKINFCWAFGYNW